MKLLSQIAQAFFDGFLPMFGFLVIAGGVWFVYHNSVNEFTKLPIIQELTDTYKIGWKETLRLSDEVASRMVVIEEMIQENSSFTDQATSVTSPTIPTPIHIPWNRGLIEKKLQKEGWSNKKRLAAGAYLAYIDRYLDEAVRDMYFSSISASITLAQGILESNAGRSRLATTTNNHFGIKARPNKSGRRKIKARQYRQLTNQDFSYRKPAIDVSQHHDDNKWDRFEVYTTVADSYQRHSDLLQNGCKKPRKGCYDWIWSAYPVQEERLDLSLMARTFEPISHFAPEDFFGETLVPYYAAQAAGLKMAGYATSKTYHEKLVYLIETYELWRIDIALTRQIEE